MNFEGSLCILPTLTHLVVHLCLGLIPAATEPGARPPLVAVPGDVARVAARRADDAVGDVGLVLALPRLVVGGPAVGAARAVALAEGAVQQSQFAQLGAPAIGRTIREGRRCFCLTVNTDQAKNK